MNREQELELALAKKTAEVNYWKNKLYIKNHEFRHCPQHNENKDYDRWFEEYVRIVINCPECEEKEQLATHDQSNK